MTIIRVLHEEAPGTPATDQHPSAVRYPVVAGIYRFADCVGGAPTQAELDAVLKTDAAGLAKIARLATDENERQADVGDSQILLDLNMTPAAITTLIDVTLFSAWTGPQRTFLKRLVRIVIACGRRIMRNGG